MTITAIYFKDENFTHVKIGYLYPNPDHLLINGTIVNHNEAKDKDYAVEGRELVVKAGHKKSFISHYLNRETGEKLSFQDYNLRLASFKNGDGDYKDLESEYMYKKMEQLYMPVRGEYFEYEDLPVAFEEAELNPDKYTCCSGRVFKRDDGEGKEGHFIYFFDKWAFANDTIKRLLEEYGIPRFNDTHDAKGVAEFYALHDKTGEYRWLELCGDEFFLKYEDVFGSIKPYNKQIYYWTYEGVRKAEGELEKWFRERIEFQLDRKRTVTVKKSSIASMKERLLDLAKRIDNNKMNRRQIVWEIQSIARDTDLLASKK